MIKFELIKEGKFVNTDKTINTLKQRNNKF